MQEIANFLNTSFEDGYLSNAEKKALKEIIRERKPSKRELDWLRSQLFDIAKTKIQGIENEYLLEWLEKANKLLLPKIQVEESINRVFFSPGTACLNAIIEQIAYATKSINICVFTISDDRIKDKILYAHHKGVSIKIITDNDKSFDRGSDIQELSESGISTKIDTTDHHMHHKFAVIDNKVTITGSFNWTRSASQYNQENILITNNAEIAKPYTDEFNRLWESMEKY